MYSSRDKQQGAFNPSWAHAHAQQLKKEHHRFACAQDCNTGPSSFPGFSSRSSDLFEFEIVTDDKTSGPESLLSLSSQPKPFAWTFSGNSSGEAWLDRAGRAGRGRDGLDSGELNTPHTSTGSLNREVGIKVNSFHKT